MSSGTPEAARLATFIRAQFAAFIASTSDPAEILSLANTALLERPGENPEFVSAVCIRLRPKEPMISWATAGHPPPLRLPSLEELGPAGGTFPLGADDLELDACHISLDRGDGVLIYTDGATDVRRDGELLGFEGLTQLLEPMSRLPAVDLASRAEAAILQWANEALRDDLCLLAIRPRSG
jgi:serine phosphatase RsbU (regulator of sigma subunit)